MRSIFTAYLDLCKPRIMSMVVVTTLLGCYMGGRGFPDPALLLCTLAGVALGAAGAAVLNNFLERDLDARMHRTRNRPLPRGVIPASHALVFGTSLVLAGVMLLALEVNLLSAFLVLLAAFLYVLVYTPMKRITWFNTAVGAVPGAIPPMAGWAAATGRLDAGAWALFGILYLWQHPHFYAIAWMFKEDYARGGFKMLPPNDVKGARTFRHILFYCLLLTGVSLLPVVLGLTGAVYLWGVGLLGLAFGRFGWVLAGSGSLSDARRLLRASILYLPAWLLLTVADLSF